MKGKYYTIMVVPHTRAKFTQLRVSAAFVLVLVIIAAAAVIATGLLPVYIHMAVERGHEIESLRAENRNLKSAGADLDNSISTLRDRVSYFESEATKFALMAGVEDLPSAQPVGGARETPPAPAPAVAKGSAPYNATRMRDEMQTLQERAGVLVDSYSVLNKVYHDQNLLLASTPSIAPVPGMISYGFGYRKDPFTGRRAFHKGLDMVATAGTSVLAPADGIVTRARREPDYGNVIYLSHGNGITTRYAHLRAFNVRVGQEVRRGEVIGFVGNTGRALGYHLHYEVLVHGTKVNPMDYILNLDRMS
ncbi:MAG TPA: M23 family metallopeptidase [Candidatus Saccharimonadales bacterium]|nr:M23 family metallopeptidase [Candidatus Saccharimonadales bacterium]